MSNYGYSAAQPAEYAINKNPSDVQKVKKKGWFTRWFNRKCHEAWNNSEIPYPSPRLSIVETSALDHIDGLNIRLYGATGGSIIEFRKYDRHKDRTDTRLYVINAEQNFAEQFTKIVSMEMLR